jgi:hypothetical protein
MKIEKRWPKSEHLKMLVGLYQSKMYDNVVLADAMLDGLTLNITDAHYILKVIRNMGIVYKSRLNYSIVKDIYRSTYYLAKIKRQAGRNYDYILIKKKK